MVCRRRFRGSNAVLVKVRDHGVVLGEDGKDHGRRPGGNVVEETGSKRAEEHGDDGHR